MTPQVRSWLLAGDPAIVWQVERDLLGKAARQFDATRNRVKLEGWGARLLDKRSADGTWGGGLYNPRWVSTFYSMQLLALLGVREDCPEAVESCRLLLERGVRDDGGVQLWKRNVPDTCVSGMLLWMSFQFGLGDSPGARRILKWLLDEQMSDGGWNCNRSRGAKHSSFHTTTSVLEALHVWVASRQRLSKRAERAAAAGREFMLLHQLYRSHRTGRVARHDFTQLRFPYWWKFDVLRGLDCFRAGDAPWDERLADPLNLVKSRQQADGVWQLRRAHPGRVWFPLETPGRASRWNTLRALRVMDWAMGGRSI